jgi:hypothetical protein
LEEVAQPASGDNSTSQLTRATIGQFVTEADIVWNDPGHAQTAAEQLAANLDVAYRRVEQLATERDALQVAVAQLTRDLDAAEQQRGHMADQLVQAQMSAEPSRDWRDNAQAELDEAQASVVQLAADLETGQDQGEQRPQAYTAYCLVCRAYRRIEGARQVTLPNGRRVVKGRCAACGIRFLEQLHSE